MDASAAVIGSVLITVGTTEIAHVINKKPMTMKPVIAGFIMGTILFGMAAMNAEFASTFCVLIIVSALAINGATIAGAITKGLS